MPRFKLTVEYDGRGLVGWQRQSNGPSVQESLETAIHRFCQEAAAVHGAGRTDAGVHALGQVAHVDLACTPTPHTVRNAINFHLKPAAIAVLTAEAVDQAFHARFSALGRAYRYRILNRPAPPVLDRGRVWWVPRDLDVEAMNEAAAVLTGRHDFSSFRAAICQASSPVRTLDRLTVRRRENDIVVEAEARSFLHHQVRNMVGALKWVGEGRWTAADLAAALAARDRRRGGPTAPAEGLYLVHVTY
ncbi:MAG: tRNA pseudouridine(38-40) synthase TruA [Rhodospirillales bacterium]|nr:MAG: tRNA pseudouridine(38-40) synthase TruA [Rhodospirillales bacterium]